MVDPIRMFVEGGPFMYLLLLLVPVNLGMVVLQLVLAKRANLMPLLWGMVAITLLVGVLGSMMGFVLAMEAVAYASAEMKTKLMANGASVALYTTTGALLLAIPQVFFTGIAGSVVATAQRPVAPPANV